MSLAGKPPPGGDHQREGERAREGKKKKKKKKGTEKNALYKQVTLSRDIFFLDQGALVAYGTALITPHAQRERSK